MCMNHCGIDVHLEDNRVVKVRGMTEHPFHHLCPKPAAYPELLYSEKRLRFPLKKRDGKFEEISWDEAFTIIADKLTQVKSRYGAQAAVFFTGNGLAVRSTPAIIRRFSEIYGTPNYISGGWTCFCARVVAFKLTVGSFPNPDYAKENRCMLVWGKDPSKSSAPENRAINVLLKKGSKLIVIDPIVTRTAKKADFHARPRPGTDCALALGLLNVIIEEGLYDREFVEQWTVGFERLAENASVYSPERVGSITSIPASLIREIAREYAGSHPASISVGVSLDHSSNGVQTMRAIAALLAICGNLEVPGGNLTFPNVSLKNMRLPEQIEGIPAIGDNFPLFTKIQKLQSGTQLTDIILAEKPYPIKALIVIGGNPIVNWPNSGKVEKALDKLDFLLVSDMFMTDTARKADLILPAASDLETEDLRSAYFNHNGLPLLVKTNRVIKPVGNCMEDWQVWAEVGRRMGYDEYFPWQTSEALLADLLEPTAFSLDQLNENPGGIVYSEKISKYYLKGGFKTPSGKVELYSKTMDRYGYDPVPTFREPVESPVSRPDLAKDYPFILIAGSREKGYTHSRYREVESLRKLHPEPVAEINPVTARQISIEAGENIRIVSPRGSLRVAVKLSDAVLAGTVVLISGWSQETCANANVLTNDEARDPVSGFPEYRATLCRVEKCVGNP